MKTQPVEFVGMARRPCPEGECDPRAMLAVRRERGATGLTTAPAEFLVRACSRCGARPERKGWTCVQRDGSVVVVTQGGAAGEVQVRRETADGLPPSAEVSMDWQTWEDLKASIIRGEWDT